MNNMIARPLFYTLYFTLLIFAGYVTGLLSLPKPNYVEAVTKSTLNIEGAQTLNLAGLEKNNQQKQQEIIVSPQEIRPEINPFTNKQFINISGPKSNKITLNNQRPYASDPRITVIDSSKIRDQDSMIQELEIKFSGQGTSLLNAPKLIDELSKVTKKRPRPQNAPQVDLFSYRKPLPKAPITGYSKKTLNGLLPHTPKNSPPLWQVYGNQTTVDLNKKPIAYVMGGLGPDEKLTIEAIKTLPPEVTLGFVPYTEKLQKYIDVARYYGHEVILEIPMESHDFPRPDVGLLALELSDTAQKHKRKLKSLLSVATGYSGVMNYLGGKYFLDRIKSKKLLNHLKDYGLYFLENKTVRVGVLASIAAQTKTPYAPSFNTVDELLSLDNIHKNYAIIEDNALKGTPIIGTTYLSRVGLSTLRSRLVAYQNNKKSDIQLIPISAYIQHTQE